MSAQDPGLGDSSAESLEQIPIGAMGVIPCPTCGKVLLTVRPTAPARFDFIIGCVPDGVSRIHPVTVRRDDVVIAEWPQAIEYGRAIAFDEALFSTAIPNGGDDT